MMLMNGIKEFIPDKNDAGLLNAIEQLSEKFKQESNQLLIALYTFQVSPHHGSKPWDP